MFVGVEGQGWGRHWVLPAACRTTEKTGNVQGGWWGQARVKAAQCPLCPSPTLSAGLQSPPLPPEQVPLLPPLPLKQLSTLLLPDPGPGG